MNDTIKPPAAFDPVPPPSPASILDLPRPLTPPPQPPRPAPRQTVPLLPLADAESPKARPPLPPGIAPEQPAAPPNPLAGSPPPKASALSGLVWDLLRPNRAKVAVFAGVVSLAAGAFGLNLLVPTGTTASSQPVKLKIPADVKQKPVAEEPKKTPPAESVHPIQAPPAVPAAPAHREPAAPGALPALPSLPGELPPLPPRTDPHVRPASGTGASSVAAVPLTPTPPAVPATPGLPSLPSVEPGSGLPALPPSAPATPPASPGGPVTPDFGAGAMPLPGGLPTPLPTPTGPKPPELPPPLPGVGTPPPLPALPGETAKPPLPRPATPALPGAGLPVAEPVKPTPPVTPATPPPLPGAGALPLPLDPVAPSPLPTPGEVTKPADVKPHPKPADVKPVEPKLPAVSNPFGDPPPTPAAPEVKPAPLPVPPSPQPVVGVGNIAPAPPPVGVPPARPPATTPPPVLEAKTGYDVDLHRTRPGDTYATVSKAYYGGARYAGALQAFNRNQPIQRVAEVQVPPVHVIRTYAETRPAGPAPTGNRYTPTRPAGDEINWGAPGSALGGEPEYTQFTVPRKGLTLRDVATTFYGSDRNWSKLNNPLNPKFTADQELPVGTKLQVPTGNITFR